MNRMTMGAAALLLTAIGLPATAPEAQAHGERAQEPYLRTRTAHWYDVKWSTENLKVNDVIVVTGKFHLFSDWPDAVNHPDIVFVSNATPGPVFARIESTLNGVPARQSFRDLEIGRDYEYKMVMKARVPGRHHVHPMIAIKGSGPLVGPGKWVDVSGNDADFVLPFTAISGEKIDDLQSWGVSDVVHWHLIWVAIAVLWVLWWIRRPLLIPRFMVLQKEREDLLTTNLDLKLGALLLVVVVGLSFYGYHWAQSKYPRTVPLQAGTMRTPPLPREASPVSIQFQKARYDVPGRAMRVWMKVTNNGPKSLRLGEFATASIRFVNVNLPAAKENVLAGFPKELVARNGLAISDDSEIKPGESKEIKLEAADAAWEIERLTSFMTDVDSKVGALLFFFDHEGHRYIAEVGGPIIPEFKRS